MVPTANNWQAYLSRGLVREKSGDHRGALSEYRKALSIKPDEGLLVHNIGVCLMHLGQLAEAERTLRRGIKLGYRSGLAYGNLGALLLRQGKRHRAFETFKEGIAADRKSPLLHYNLTCHYALDGDAQGALRELGKALRKGYKNWRHLESDPDLLILRNLEAYKRLLCQYSPLKKYSRERVTYRGRQMPRYLREDILHAQRTASYRIEGRKHIRLRFGSEKPREVNPRGVCGDCGVFEGQFHQPGCDVEQCPLCHRQALSCPHLDHVLYE